MPPPLATGVWPKDSVKDVAESVGISTLSDSVCTALASDVEYRLHEVIEEAIKFMRHSKRTRLKVDDIDAALKVRNVEPLWGFNSSSSVNFKKTTAGRGNLYFVDDEEIDLSKMLATPLPPIPRDVSYTAHWLAIEGVQPAVPQNPTPNEIKLLTATAPTRHSYTHPPNTSLPSSGLPTAGTTSSNTQGSTSNSSAQPPAGTTLKPLIKHVLSRELQLYFERVTSAALDSDATMRQAALISLREDPGLSGLVMYLIQWCAERVTVGLRDVAGLEGMLDVLEAICANRSLFVEPYLHQIIPCVLTMLLTSSLGPTPSPVPPNSASTSDSPLSPHSPTPPDTPVHSLRRHAASLLSSLLGTYGTAYTTLKPRVLDTLLRALFAPPGGGTVGTRFGAVLGLRGMGKEAVRGALGRVENLKRLGEELVGTVGEDQRGLRDVRICAEEVLNTLEATLPPQLLPQHQGSNSAPLPSQSELSPLFSPLFASLLSSPVRSQSAPRLVAELTRTSNGSGDEVRNALAVAMGLGTTNGAVLDMDLTGVDIDTLGMPGLASGSGQDLGMGGMDLQLTGEERAMIESLTPIVGLAGSGEEQRSGQGQAGERNGVEGASGVGRTRREEEEEDYDDAEAGEGMTHAVQDASMRDA